MFYDVVFLSKFDRERDHGIDVDNHSCILFRNQRHSYAYKSHETIRDVCSRPAAVPSSTTSWALSYHAAMWVLARLALTLSLACGVLPGLGRAQSITGNLTLAQGENNVYSSAYYNGFYYAGTNTQPGIVAKVATSNFSEVGALQFQNTSISRFHSAIVDPTAGVLYMGQALTVVLSNCVGSCGPFYISSFLLCLSFSLFNKL